MRRLFCILILTGFGTALGQPKLTVNIASIDFGNVRVGEYVETNILVANTGNAALQVTSIHASSSAVVVRTISYTLAPGSAVRDTLRFVPLTAGTFVGSLTIVSNDSVSPTVIPMKGFGLSDGFVDARTQAYRDEPKGERGERKEGKMDGNRVATLFYNDGEVGKWQFQPSGEWPSGTKHTYLDGVAVLIGAKLVAPGNSQTITPIETAYREVVDTDPQTGEEWVLQPVPGYTNPYPVTGHNSPAVNRDTLTFPPVWPTALGLTPAWNGYWYGYFGRGVTNADFETFFVMDDSKDREFTRPPYLYYPIASDSTRGGLGLRVEVRGFQWSHVLAEDIIFWHYDIVNLSDRDYDSTCFGFSTDPGVGSYGTSTPPNSALYNSSLDLTYAWAQSGKGLPDNWKTGYVGYAYLESPGNGQNGFDDDGDGMTDERRDDNIDNDHDWVPYLDVNGNGKWDFGEPLNDDVGRDGVGPTDPQYSGADEGEGDGVPTHGEPNFDETDKDESDQIGLTAMTIKILDDTHGPNGLWAKNDGVLWNAMNNGFRDTTVQNANITMVFSSGPFPLKETRRERFSMALVFGDDLDGLVFNKETVQEIYNANYNFSKPPFTPHLTAVAGNRRTFLYWDAIAEQSQDRFLGYEDPNDPSKGYKRDFEGYLVYRSTDFKFNDIKLITDSKGTPKYWKPIAQYDLVDSISGPDPVGINGARFWRGSNTALQHSYVDTTVTNGVRYYYAVVSYDKGDPHRGTKGLQPTESPKIIREDLTGMLEFSDINCAVVTPNGPAAGYTPPRAEGDLLRVQQGLGTGRLELVVMNPSEIVEGSTYKVMFKSDTTIPVYRTKTLTAVCTRSGETDTTWKDLPLSTLAAGKYTGPFDGIVLGVVNDTAVVINDSATGWLVGSSNVMMRAAKDNSLISRNVAWPADYEIEFGESAIDTTAFSAAPRYPKMPVNFKITNTTNGSRVKFIVDDVDRSTTFTLGDTIRILDGYVNSSTYKIAWKVTYGRPFFGTLALPVAGDRFVIKTRRPFLSGDYFTFTMHAQGVDNAAAQSQLSQITVVPNPYIVTAPWERRTTIAGGRNRKIEFKKLPAKCTVRIYTVTGALVKTLTKDTSPQDGSLAWDLVSEDGMDIAYGLYVFHVEAPGIGDTIGKFAVVK